ncbi:hypothetical protein [Nocardiopsis potens]|uniref:hypothetical protein n=1 Tax=Nocardiopsis potens TaxID=1246458 RepID=UPI00034C0FC1|nr:hypothetical protein [Nocardiopsis potens]
MSRRDPAESGPQDSLRTYVGDPNYTVVPGALPRRVRVGTDGALWGEVPVVPAHHGATAPPARTSRTDGHVVTIGPARRPDGRPAGAAASSPARAQAVPDVEGFDLRPDPMEALTPAEFMDALRRYRRWAGNPSLREMSERCGGVYSSSAICTALKSDLLPRYTMLNAVITGCAGKNAEAEFQRWVTAWRRLDGQEKGEPQVRPQIVLVRSPEEDA